MTVPADLASIVEELEWLASRGTPGGPIDILLSYAAKEIMRAAQAIVDASCPLCGRGTARTWRAEEIRRLGALRASYDEGLIERDDVIPLMRHFTSPACTRQPGRLVEARGKGVVQSERG